MVTLVAAPLDVFDPLDVLEAGSFRCKSLRDGKEVSTVNDPRAPVFFHEEVKVQKKPDAKGTGTTSTQDAVDSEPLDFLRKFLILALCPFLYGAATRLPFIYYVIHLDAHFGDQITETFGSKWFPIGCFVAAYQVSH